MDHKSLILVRSSIIPFCQFLKLVKIHVTTNLPITKEHVSIVIFNLHFSETEKEKANGRRKRKGMCYWWYRVYIIKRLLENGYSVNTTVNSQPGDKKGVSFLTNLPGAPQKLQIFNADFSNPESFSAALEGCFGVFHVATPVDFLVREPEEVVAKRSIDGAICILKACQNSNTVKRVVYTSSAAAVLLNGKDDEVMDESFWSDVDFLKASKPFAWSYTISKILTEKAVLEFGEQNGLDVVTLVPTYVVGPFICPKLPGSERDASDKDQKDLLFHAHVVHVDDVARAHIFFLEHPNPKGRYICCKGIITIQKLHQLLSAKYPEYQIPTLGSLKKVEDLKLPNLYLDQKLQN